MPDKNRSEKSIADAMAFAKAHQTEYLNTAGDYVEIGHPEELSNGEHAELLQHLRVFIPWRKGPFNVFGHRIEAQWRSNRKWDRVLSILDTLEGMHVADLGCNNGYYMFRMISLKPGRVTGFDPVKVFYNTFQFLNTLSPCSAIDFQKEGYQALKQRPGLFDLVFCMGILYHHSDPIGILRIIHKSLRAGGRLILETMGLPEEAGSGGSRAFFPGGKFAGAKGIYFLPDLQCLFNWLKRSAFREIEMHSRTNFEGETQTTDWSPFQAPESFINPDNPRQTIEGYTVPERFLISAMK